MDRDLLDEAQRLLADLATGPLPTGDQDAGRVLGDVARRAAELVGPGARGSLLRGAASSTDPHEAAALALAAAVCGSTMLELADDLATFAAVATGAATAVPNVALAEPGAGPVTALLDGSRAGVPAPRPQRLTEVYVAGMLVRVNSRAVSLDDGLAATARVQSACAAVDALDLDEFLRHVYRDALHRAALDEPAARAALAAGTLPLNVLQRITGGILAEDRAVARKGWTRAAAVLLAVSHAAGLQLSTAEVRGTASRLASDPALLGRPETTITDLLTTVLGLQAAIALGGAGDDAPVRHLLARVVAHIAA